MSSRDQRLPIRRMGDLSIMDSEFNNIKDRFDNEMKKMEEEMDKFRNDLLDRETTNFFTKSSNTSTSGGGKDMLSGSGLGGHSNWLEGLQSPLIQPSAVGGGQKELKLRFDVSQYSPEEIMVKTVDNKLMVHAKHEENTDGKSVFREYNREFLLPGGTNPELIKSTLSKDGILTVEAPLPQPAIEDSNKTTAIKK